MVEIVNSILSNEYAHLILRLLLASLFGALIGIEREHARRPAGLRTHMIVCVASTLAMLISIFGFVPAGELLLPAHQRYSVGYSDCSRIDTMLSVQSCDFFHKFE